MDSFMIKASDEFLSGLMLVSLRFSRTALQDVPIPSGKDGEDMPAIKEFLAVTKRLDDVVKLYAGLIGRDADKITEIIGNLKASDQ